MKIHFYTTNPFPVGMAATKRIQCYSQGLLYAGNSVCIHVCNRLFNTKRESGYPDCGEYKGIYYDYVSGQTKHTKKILRGLDWYFFDALRCFPHVMKNVQKGDIIFVYLYPMFTQIILLFATRLKGAKIVKETCEHPSALGDIHSIWHKFCRLIEYKFVMPYYDGFVTISRELDKFVYKYKSKTAKSIIVPILVDEDKNKRNWEKIVPPYDVPYIIHTGTMHEQKDSISKILYAFSRFRHETNTDCRLVFTGPHANEKCSFLPLIKQLGIEDSVDLLGLVSTERIVSLQHFAAMAIIYKSDNLQTRNCFPTKLGEMLINGIPVITTTVGDANLYLENGKNAFIIEPDDEDKLVEYIKYILDNPEESEIIGNAGRLVAQRYFNLQYQGKRLSDFYESLM